LAETPVSPNVLVEYGKAPRESASNDASDIRKYCPHEVLPKNNVPRSLTSMTRSKAPKPVQQSCRVREYPVEG
jgi:hypothetical protein